MVRDLFRPVGKLCLLLAGALALMCSGQVARAQCYSIEDAIYHAAEISPQVASAGYLVEQSEYTVDGLNAQKKPQVSAFARTGQGDGSLQSGQLDNQFGVELSYRLYDFGKSSMRVKGAKAEAEAGESNVDRIQRAVADELLQSLVRLKLSESILAIYQRRLDVLETRVEQARDQLKDNTITIMDFSRLESDAATIRYEVQDARVQAETALLVVQRILNDDQACIATDQLFAFFLAHKAEDVDALVGDLENAPQLLEIEKRIEAADYQRRSAAREWMPEVSASAFSSQVYNDFTDEYVGRDRIGIQVVAPLYDGGVRNSETGRLRSRVNQLRAEYQAAEDRLRQQKLTSWTSVLSLEASMLTLEDALTSSKSFVDATQKRYDLQAGTIDDLLVAEERLMNLQIRYQYVQAEYYYVMIDLLKFDLLD